nr:MAG TPA: hypothetical protein [Caudoviricetes sp.]
MSRGTQLFNNLSTSFQHWRRNERCDRSPEAAQRHRGPGPRRG